MKKKLLEKLLALLLVLVMCFSLLPVSAFAEDEAGDDPIIEEPEGELPETVKDDPPHEHEYFPVVTAPTCTEGGYTTWTCTCGDFYVTDETDALGHTAESVEAVAPTCTEAGHEAGTVCAVCGVILDGCTEIPAAGHSPMPVEAVPATETEAGHEAGVVCSVCGTVLEGCEEIPLPEDGAGQNHLLGTDDIVASGSCGYNLTWTLDDEGTLTISGSGLNISEYSNNAGDRPPWYLYRDSIYKIVVGSGVERIGSFAFYSCSACTEVVLPGSLRQIARCAFSGCSLLTELEIPASVEYIGTFALNNCGSLTSLTIPASVTSIDDDAFCNCPCLTKVIILCTPTIGDSILSGCPGLKTAGPIGSDCNIEFAWTDEIPNYAFSATDTNGSMLESVLIPTGVRRIGNSAFWQCAKLTEITIPEGVTQIGTYAFYNCRNLAEITLPVSLKSIGDYAFDFCSSLTDVYYAGSKKQWQAITIGENNSYLLNATIHFSSTPPVPVPDRLDLCLERDSTVYDKELALIAADLSLATYTGSANLDSDASVKEYLYEHGFSDKNIYSNNYGGSLAFTVGVKPYDGPDADGIMVIVAQGTTNMYETFQDVWSGYGDIKNGYEVYDVVRDFHKDIFAGIDQLRDPEKEYKVLVTGHSLGGAAANLVAATLTRAYYGPSNVFCYTFGAIDCIAKPKQLVTHGYENIHNIYNLLDTFSPYQYGSNQITGMGKMLGKFGKLHFFIHEFRTSEEMNYHTIDQMHAAINHKVENYISAIQSDEIQANWHRWEKECVVYNLFYNVEIYNGESLVAQILDGNVVFAQDGVEIENTPSATFIFFPAQYRFIVRLRVIDDITSALENNPFIQIFTINAASGMTKEFFDFQLPADTLLTTSVSGGIPVPDIRLLIVDEQDTPIREVLEDGTEILYLEDPTQWPESFALDQEYMILKPGQEAQLSASSLPANWFSSLQWSSDDASVATVDPATGEVTAVAEGTAWITGSVDTGKGVLSARCRVDVVESQAPEGEPEDPHPIATDLSVDGVRLIDTKATVELYKTDYTRITVLPELSQNQTASAAEPVIVSPPPVPANSGVAITAAVFDDTNNADINDLFSLRVVDDRTLEIIPSYEALELGAANSKTLKGSYKAAVIVTVDGTAFTTAPLTLTVKKTLPKVTAKAVKFNSFLPEQTVALDFGGMRMASVEVDTSMTDPAKPKQNPAWALFDAGAGTVRYTGEPDSKASGTLYLQVCPEGWAVKVPVKVSLSAAPTKPKLSLKPTTVSLQPVGADSATASVTVTPAQFADCKIEVVGITGGKEDPGAELSVETDRNPLLVTTTSSTPNDGKAYTYKVTLGVIYKDAPAATAVLTVKLLAKKAATLSLKANGAIDLAIPNSPVTIVPTLKNIGKNVTFEVSDICDASGASMMAEGLFDISGLMLTGTDELKDTLLPGQQAKYTAAVTATYPGGSIFKTVPFTVKHSAKAPAASVALKATGGVDVIRPGSAVTLTPTTKNLYGYTLSPEDLSIVKTYDGAAKQKMNEAADGLFTVAVEDGRYVVTGNTGLSHLDKFTVTAKIGGVPSKAVALTVKMGTVKITQSAKAVTLLKTDKYSRASVTLTLSDPALAGIDWTRTVDTFNASASPYTLKHLSGDTVEICYREGVAPKAGTAKIPVFLTGNQSTKANATISVSVKLA